jgi:hypothetical protein
MLRDAMGAVVRADVYPGRHDGQHIHQRYKQHPQHQGGQYGPGQPVYRESEAACILHLESEASVSQLHPYRHKTTILPRGYSQLSRSCAVLMHSHARAPPSKTPHAAQSGPISAQDPLPSQRFLLADGAYEGHDPASTHWPLQTTEGVWKAQVVGLSAGEGVNPSVHWNPHGFPSIQAGVLSSG